MIRKTLLALAVGVCAAATGHASAAVLYQNGSADQTSSADLINYGGAVADSFTIGQTSTITGVSFTSWDFPGVSIDSIGYAIESSSSISAPTTDATVTSTFDYTQQPNGYHINDNTFAVTPTTLAAGTYYLLLGNAMASGGAETFWAESPGPSSFNAGFADATQPNAFQIDGASAVSATPEPASWALMIVGVGLAGAALRLTSLRRSGAEVPA